MNILPFKASYPIEELSGSPTFVKEVKHNYWFHFRSGAYTTHSKKELFAHRIINDGKVSLGLVGLASFESFDDGSFLPHEKTIYAKEKITYDFFEDRRGLIKPVAAGYPHHVVVDQILKKSVKRKSIASVQVQKKIRHDLFTIDKSDQQKIKRAFKRDVPFSIISDGHHRAKVARELHHVRGNADGVMTIFYSFDQLEIKAYHRVAEMGHKAITRMLSALDKFANLEILEEARLPADPMESILFHNGRCYVARWSSAVMETFHHGKEVLFNSMLVESLMLRYLFGIKDVREDTRLSYLAGVSNARQLQKLSRRNKNKVIICLYPVSKESLIQACRSGQTLPAKSTWFLPRLVNGIVTHKYL